MKTEEILIYREIQKNAEKAMKAIEVLEDKVYEEEFGMQISRQALKYSDMRNRAVDRLLSAKAEPVHVNYLSDAIQRGSIHMNTLFNTSTGHIAEMMIEGSNRGMVSMLKVLKHNNRGKLAGAVQSIATEMAEEFMRFEEKNVEIMKKYL